MPVGPPPIILLTAEKLRDDLELECSPSLFTISNCFLAFLAKVNAFHPAFFCRAAAAFASLAAAAGRQRSNNNFYLNI